jgi:membrane protein CcdC involved in cytochrome C biogenesis
MIIVPNSDMFMGNGFLFIILLIVLLQLRERKVKIWSLILFPAFMLYISLSLIYNELFSSYYSFILIIAGFLIGIILGIIIGRFFEVKVSEKDGSLVLKGSYIAVFLWISIILIKVYGENILNQGIIAADLLTSMFLMMTLGAMISRRIIIYRKYLKHREIKNSDSAVIN